MRECYALGNLHFYSPALFLNSCGTVGPLVGGWNKSAPPKVGVQELIVNA